MNIIEQLGGYAEAKKQVSRLESRGNLVTAEGMKLELLEYRRHHNIFEIGDKVVSINSAFIEYEGVLNIDFIDRFDLMLSDDCKGFEVNAICGWSKIIRHATNEEIASGHRL